MSREDLGRPLGAELGVVGGRSATGLPVDAGASLPSPQRYRDRRSQCERALADLVSEEAWPHERLRRLRRHPALELSALARVEAVVDEWRAPVGRAQIDPEVVVYDPTQWTTDDLIADVHQRPLETPVELTMSASVRVEIREAWRPPKPVYETAHPQPPGDATVFEATVVAINVGNQPVYITVLGLESTTEPVGVEDRRDRNVRLLPARGSVSYTVAEDETDFNMRTGVRGFAELATGPTVYSEPLVLSDR